MYKSFDSYPLGWPSHLEECNCLLFFLDSHKHSQAKDTSTSKKEMRCMTFVTFLLHMLKDFVLFLVGHDGGN